MPRAPVTGRGKRVSKRQPEPRQRKTWQRLPPAVRKTSIIWGFMEEAVASGSIEAASLRGAATRARCTTPLIYNLFGSRQDLIRESVRWTYRTLLENLEKLSGAHDLSARRRLDAIAAYVGGRELGDQEIYEALIMLECRSDPDLAAEFRSVFGRVAKLLEAIVGEGVRAGEFRKGLDLEHVAWRLVDLGISRNYAFLTKLDAIRGEDHPRKVYDALMREIEAKGGAEPARRPRGKRS